MSEFFVNVRFGPIDPVTFLANRNPQSVGDGPPGTNDMPGMPDTQQAAEELVRDMLAGGTDMAEFEVVPVESDDDEG